MQNNSHPDTLIHKQAKQYGDHEVLINKGFGNARHQWLTLLFLILASYLHAQTATNSEQSFYTLNRQNGLSDNCVLSLLQLTDGRLVAVTRQAVDVYDGQRFSSVPIDTTQWAYLPAYNGATHLFADGGDRLWMKHWGRLYCFDLRTMSQLPPPRNWNYDDFYIDQQGHTWHLKGQQLRNTTDDYTLTLPATAGHLQDLVTRTDTVYTFFDTGTVAAYSPDGPLLYTSVAYDSTTSRQYHWTSLVVGTADSPLYQVRTGPGGSVLQSFDTHSHQWQQLMSSTHFMHTLTLTPTGTLTLTTPDGYLHIDPTTGHRQTFSELRLPDGTVLSGEGVNAVCMDREGGFWLGTYSSGLLYTSPLSGLFDTQPIDIDVQPILTAIYLHGQPLQVGYDYNGQTLLSVTPPYVEHLVFNHDQNSLAFQFSTMNYVRPRSTCYRYRFTGDTGQWHTLSADSASRLVDDKGVFYLPLVSLAPGDYTLQVMATTNPHHWQNATVRTISFTIRHPWWQTPLAYLLYIILIVAAVAAAFQLQRRRLQRRQREDMLLLRIQNLVEQVNQYEHSETLVVLSEPEPTTETKSEPEPTPQEKEFMARATQLVEQHLKDPQYGVEQLAADLCMERTGLYKKLTALVEQSPVAFIRSIRLHRAADLLSQGHLSIADIAARTGFSSTSYFSKCFQREFDCKPSEYRPEPKTNA
ncbi:MAG: helix-turn-helix domain-containing protein [Prevotella sp.]|nr:helix-turn-helix domain-containing protein [Prevotella sp.]